MEKNDEKKVGIGMYIVVAALVITAFFLGFVVKGMLKDDKKESNTEKDKKEEKQDVEPQKDTSVVSPMDNIVVNLYGGGYVYYIIDEDVYYLKADYLEDGRYFLLTYAPCLRDDQKDDKEYCEMNQVYGRKAIKVEGLDNAIKLRLLHRPGATDESFETFAVDKSGNAYMIKDGIASLYYGNNDVEDILSDTQVLLKDGTIKTIK